MEKMLFRTEPVRMTMAITGTSESGWRQALPVLAGRSLTLRELRVSDAPALLAMLASEEVAKFISPAPATIAGFEQFIACSQRERQAGNFLCFGIVPNGSDTPVGLFQLRQTEPGFATAEWGFALGSAYWGSGMFMEAANLVLDFAFDVIGVHRVEARAVVQNGRGNGALRKLGALQEGILRRSFRRNGEYLDQVLWTIISTDREQSRIFSGPLVH